MNNRILSGIQPTGQLHIGNYLGAIKNWVKLQQDYDCFFCIVDLHAITLAQNPAQLIASTRSVAATYIAAGIDPEGCAIFNQSYVTGHTQLSWILGCLTPLGWLNRMTQFKDKAGKQRESAGLGLYGYPVLQAADILLYHATHVPVGEDQKQHLELARDIAGAFNRHVGQDYFTLPEPQIFGHATRVMSLRDGTKKMSKSDESDYALILLNDTPEIILQKIKKAKTDAEPLPEQVDLLEGRPEANNLVTLYAAFTDQTKGAVLAEFAGANFSVFKPRLAEVIIEHLRPISQKLSELEADQSYIDQILRQGGEKAAAVAEQTMLQVNQMIGLLGSSL